jgi:hypothetical protein
MHSYILDEEARAGGELTTNPESLAGVFGSGTIQNRSSLNISPSKVRANHMFILLVSHTILDLAGMDMSHA